MKSRLLIALLSLGLGLNTVLLIVTVRKLEHVERQVSLERPSPAESPPEPTDDENPEGERGGPPMLFGLPRVDPEALDLTPEQHEQIRRLRAEWKEEEGERFRKSMERRREIPDLFEAHEDAKSRLAAVLALYKQYQEILTPEQQERFKELIREQQREHRSHWERFRERDSRRGRRNDDSDSRSRGRGRDSGRDDDPSTTDDHSGRRDRYREERMRNESEIGGPRGIDPRRLERFREERQRRQTLQNEISIPEVNPPEDEFPPAAPPARQPPEPGRSGNAFSSDELP